MFRIWYLLIEYSRWIVRISAWLSSFNEQFSLWWHSYSICYMHCSSTPYIKQNAYYNNMEFYLIFTLAKKIPIVIVVFWSDCISINCWYLCYLMWKNNSNFIELTTDFLASIVNAARFIQRERKFYYLNGINHIDVSL